MAELTLKDVLDAIAEMRAESKVDLSKVQTDLSKVQTDLSKMDMRLATVEAKVDAHRAETARGFAELDSDLSRHVDGPHREIEQEIAAIKRRLPAKKAVAPRVRRR